MMVKLELTYSYLCISYYLPQPWASATSQGRGRLRGISVTAGA